MIKNHNYYSGVYLLRVVSPPGFLLGPQGQSLRSFPFGGPGPPIFLLSPKAGPKALVVRVVTSGSRSFGKLVGLLPSSRSYVWWWVCWWSSQNGGWGGRVVEPPNLPRIHRAGSGAPIR